jgi:poly(3-hydroxybutyrate) depolymerase
MLILLHGGGQKLTTMVSMTRDVATALGDRVILVYPQSVASYWEDAARQNFDMIADIKKWSEDQYCVETRKVIVGGFSSGANFAAHLACRLPAQYAAAVMAGGDFLDRACQMTKLTMPALVMVGQSDTSHINGSNRLAEYFRQSDGCMPTKAPSKVAPCVEYQGCPSALPVIYCLFQGGHDWPRSFGGQVVADLLSRI